MSASEREGPERFSPRGMARLAGVLSLVGIVTGAFDIGYVRSVLVVAGDPAATLRNIVAHTVLFRVGFCGHLLLLLCNIGAEVALFLLLRRVNLVVAAVAMVCGLVGTAIEGLNMLAAWVPMQMAAHGSGMAAFDAAQQQGLAYFALQLEDSGLLISFVFYGLDELLEGYLIYRSGFLPRVLGVLLSIAGLCYGTQAFLSFAAPALESHVYPAILFPCLPGEGAIALWLAVAGVNVARWRACNGGFAVS